MDTIETFILMCEKAEEIQALRTIAINYGGSWPKKWDVEGRSISTSPEDIEDNFQDGDVIVLDGEVYVIGTTIYHPQRWCYPDKTGHYELPLVGYDEGDGINYTLLVWLPRQDQLQEMIEKPEDFIGNWPVILTEKMLEWQKEEHYGIYHWGESFEQLWLAFVMKEKYNKVWDGEKWQID